MLDRSAARDVTATMPEPMTTARIPLGRGPRGTTLEPVAVADGVFAVMADRSAATNSGFVVGERGVLVVDAQIDGTLARQVQATIAGLTDKPLLYLVNTNEHGDHYFGNHAFPAETHVIAHRFTAERMRAGFEAERRRLRELLGPDGGALDDVRLRLPDVMFQEGMLLDLGSRTVELHRFGRGECAGDTVVHVPDVQVAFTGNLVLAEGSIPWLRDGHPRCYLRTLRRLQQRLDVTTVVPSHGVIGTGAATQLYEQYLGQLVELVAQAVSRGQSCEQTLAASEEIKERFVPSSLEGPLAAYFAEAHRHNVLVAYAESEAQRSRWTEQPCP